MAQYLVIIAMLIWMVGIAFATDNSWKNTGITWGFVILGSILFSDALTF